MRLRKYGEETRVMRIPLSLVPKVEALLEKVVPLNVKKKRVRKAKMGQVVSVDGEAFTPSASPEQAFLEGYAVGMGQSLGYIIGREVQDREKALLILGHQAISAKEVFTPEIARLSEAAMLQALGKGQEDQRLLPEKVESR